MYCKLRSKLKELDIDQPYLAKILGVCTMSVSHKFTGKTDWQSSEMYAIMDLIREPYELLYEYFPKGGIEGKNNEGVIHKNSSFLDLLTKEEKEMLVKCVKRLLE